MKWLDSRMSVWNLEVVVANLTSATSVCVGQRGAATTTEVMLGRHGFRLGRMEREVKGRQVPRGKEYVGPFGCTKVVWAAEPHTCTLQPLRGKKTVQEIHGLPNFAITMPHLRLA